MKQFTTLLIGLSRILVLALPLIVNAASITSEAARKAATNFLRTELGIANPILTLYQTRLANTEDFPSDKITETTPCFYIFNLQPNEGYVIVSADDAALPILAYSTSGSFSSDNIPPAQQEWLNSYAAEIMSIKSQKLKADSRAKQQWKCLNEGRPLRAVKAGTPVVYPLLKSAWWQGCYYNLYCPYDTAASSTACDRAATGCVATAMAQIMRYWEYPVHGTGTHTYQSDYGPLTANFGAATYNYSLMPFIANSASTIPEVEAVSLLMYHCGVSVDMHYGPTGSGAGTITTTNSPSVQFALPTYFGYSPGLQGLRRVNFTEADWVQMLKNDLNKGRPIEYSGFNPNSGHAFVFDGYDDQNMFHIDWGVNGTNNGWHTVNDLNYSSTTGWNDYQNALMGIRPFGTTTACGTEGFDNGITPPADWIFSSITNTYTTQGNYGTASPSLKFDAAKDQVVTTDVVNPSSLKFWMRGISTSNSSIFTVEGFNGTAWVVIGTIKKIPTSPQTKTYANVGAYKTFRFTLTKGPGAVAFDDVVIGCPNSSPIPQAISTADVSPQVDIYPNPGSGTYTMDCSGFAAGTAVLSVYDIYGRILFSQEINLSGQAFTKSLDLKLYSNGVYLIRMTTSEEQITKQVVKQ